MPDETLEQVRLLSNLESNRHKLLQIVLFGQPELDDTLAKPGLRQLRDRITNSFRMRPLSESEVAKYISFRMRAAGYRGPDVFSARAVGLVTRASSGLTRRINILADKSLLAAYTENAHAIADRQVRAAIADSEFAAARKPRRAAVFLGAALAVGVIAGASIQWALSSRSVPSAPPAAAAPALKIEPAPVAAPPPRIEPEKKPEPLLAAVAPAARQLGREQQQRFAGYSPASQPLLSARLAATRETLDRAPGERHGLELFTTGNTDPARMERFLLRARELVPLENIFVIPIASGGNYQLRVVYGEFASRNDALDAARRLPPKYQHAFHASPRSFAELRSQI